MSRDSAKKIKKALDKIQGSTNNNTFKTTEHVYYNYFYNICKFVESEAFLSMIDVVAF